MQTFLLLWAASSVAIFSVVFIVRADNDRQRGLGRVAMLAAFWPPILLGLFVSFLVWSVRKSVAANSVRGEAL